MFIRALFVLLFTTICFVSEIVGLHPKIMAYVLLITTLCIFIQPTTTMQTVYFYFYIFLAANTVTKLANIQINDVYNVTTFTTCVLLITLTQLENTKTKNMLVTTFMGLCLTFQSRQLSLYEFDHTLAIVFKYFIFVTVGNFCKKNTDVFVDFESFLFLFFIEEWAIPVIYFLKLPQIQTLLCNR